MQGSVSDKPVEMTTSPRHPNPPAGQTRASAGQGSSGAVSGRLASEIMEEPRGNVALQSNPAEPSQAMVLHEPAPPAAGTLDEQIMLLGQEYQRWVHGPISDDAALRLMNVVERFGGGTLPKKQQKAASNQALQHFYAAYEPGRGTSEVDRQRSDTKVGRLQNMHGWETQFIGNYFLTTFITESVRLSSVGNAHPKALAIYNAVMQIGGMIPIALISKERIQRMLVMQRIWRYGTASKFGKTTDQTLMKRNVAKETKRLETMITQGANATLLERQINRVLRAESMYDNAVGDDKQRALIYRQASTIRVLTALAYTVAVYSNMILQSATHDPHDPPGVRQGGGRVPVSWIIQTAGFAISNLGHWFWGGPKQDRNLRDEGLKVQIASDGPGIAAALRARTGQADGPITFLDDEAREAINGLFKSRPEQALSHVAQLFEGQRLPHLDTIREVLGVSHEDMAQWYVLQSKFRDASTGELTLPVMEPADATRLAALRARLPEGEDGTPLDADAHLHLTPLELAEFEPLLAKQKEVDKATADFVKLQGLDERFAGLEAALPEDGDQRTRLVAAGEALAVITRDMQLLAQGAKRMDEDQMHGEPWMHISAPRKQILVDVLRENKEEFSFKMYLDFINPFKNRANSSFSAIRLSSEIAKLVSQEFTTNATDVHLKLYRTILMGIGGSAASLAVGSILNLFTVFGHAAPKWLAYTLIGLCLGAYLWSEARYSFFVGTGIQQRNLMTGQHPFGRITTTRKAGYVCKFALPLVIAPVYEVAKRSAGAMAKGSANRMIERGRREITRQRADAEQGNG